MFIVDLRTYFLNDDISGPSGHSFELRPRWYLELMLDAAEPGVATASFIARTPGSDADLQS